MDNEFIDIYLSCINLYIDALEQHGWNNYPVRYARMLHSLSLFTNAASHLPGMEQEYKLLYETGVKSIDYSVRNINHLKLDYQLLINGFNAMKKELIRFEANEAKVVPNT